MGEPAIKLPDAITTLTDEHRYMTLLLETLDEELQTADPKIAEDFFLMQDIVRYLHEYSDAVHHPTEDIMFGKLLMRDPSLKKDVDRLLHDHELLTANTAEILELLNSAAAQQTPEASEAVRASTAKYTTRLRKHMRLEESVVFPRAIQCLANKDWHAIESRLEATDDPLFGANVGRDYRLLYEYFSDRADSVSQRLTKQGFLQLDSMIVTIDAFEMGLVEFWDMLQDRVEALSKECRETREQTFGGHGIATAIGAQLQFATFLGKTVFDVGSDSAGIYFRTLKEMVRPFFSEP